MAQVTSGVIVHSDWLRCSDFRSSLSRNQPVRITAFEILKIVLFEKFYFRKKVRTGKVFARRLRVACETKGKYFSVKFFFSI